MTTKTQTATKYAKQKIATRRSGYVQQNGATVIGDSARPSARKYRDMETLPLYRGIAKKSRAETKEQTDIFDEMQGLKENWDGRGSLAPESALPIHARTYLKLLEAAADYYHYQWTEPDIGVNERGQIVFEWWRGKRRLTLFVRSLNVVEYLKSWGIHIINDMEDGVVSDLNDSTSLFLWLYDESEATV